MACSEISSKIDMASKRKVAQLCAAIKDKSEDFNREYFERILKKECNTHYEKTDSYNLLQTACEYGNIEAFEILLQYGVDFTVTNSEGDTVLHKMTKEKLIKELGQTDPLQSVFPFIYSVILAHVMLENHTNPICKYNLSHFHIACMTSNVEAIQFFLKNGIDINHAVSNSSPIFAGFTPLHFAIKLFNYRVIKILLDNKADVHLKNANGMTSLDLLIKQKIDEKVVPEDILELLAKHFINVNENLPIIADNLSLSNLHLACIVKDTSVMKSVLGNVTDNSIIDYSLHASSPICPGYTPLHLATHFGTEKFKLLIDKGANVEAKDVNNSTPFDLCMKKFSVEDIHYIISSQTQWKDITLSDKITKLIDVISVMKNIDKFIGFLTNVTSISDLVVPEDSPLWPGYTILHLAVALSEKRGGTKLCRSSDIKIVKECLTREAEVTKTDFNGYTPLHLAFYQQKFGTVQILLQYHQSIENPIDKNDLSHFHIACAAGNQKVVEKFLSNTIDIHASIKSTIKWIIFKSSYLKYLFLPAGSTALHISVACGYSTIIKLLLENGANVYAKDIHGSTAIHRLFTNFFSEYEKIDNILLNLDDLKDSINKNGLSHLHVACHFNNIQAVKKLLDSDANVNAIVTYNVTPEIEENYYRHDYYGDPSKKPLSDLFRYSGFTPLHFTFQFRIWKDHSYLEDTVNIQKQLLNKGADFLAGSSLRCIPAEKILGYKHEYDDIVLSIFMNNDALKDRLKDQWGLTILHIACYVINPKLVNDLLWQDEDVNARIDEKCSIWPGYTPLHIAADVLSHFKGIEQETDALEIVKILTENGADVDCQNKNKETPIHLVYKFSSPTGQECSRLLLSSLKNFDIDVAHSQSMSFFHLACLLKDLPVVKAFVKNGIDVNRPVDFFADDYAGSSPLHLAAKCWPNKDTSQLKIVNLLLERGADVHAKDISDNTPIHSAAYFGSARAILFDTFIGAGTDIFAMNIHGQTVLEILMTEEPNWKDVELLLKRGLSINSFNSITQEGYIAKIFEDRVNDEDTDPEDEFFWSALKNDMILSLIDSEYINEVDNKGRSILHNIVSIGKVNIKDYKEVIEELIKRGCDVNHQDNEGRTALHTATWFRNKYAIDALLKNGADINIIDSNGDTAVVYCFNYPHDRHLYEDYSDCDHVVHLFDKHIHRMKICGLYVNKLNQKMQLLLPERYYMHQYQIFDFMVTKTKEIKMGSTDLTLYDFGFKIDFQMVYPIMALSERLEIDEFFENFHQRCQINLIFVDYLLKLKYKQAVAKLQLIDLAVVPFGGLVKNQLPEFCCRVILNFLSNSDLKNVIALKNLK